VLVWNKRLMMERGVGVAASGLDLLNGQTTKLDSIASVEGVGLGLFTKQGFRTYDFAACVGCLLRLTFPARRFLPLL
jgi:hypothetical protein